MHECFDKMLAEDRLDYLPHHSVGALSEGKLHVTCETGHSLHGNDRLIIATGATARVAPVPGWEAPGVYSLGAAQIALKAQGVALRRQIVLMGSGPLLTLVALQLIKAEAGVAAVIDTSSMRQQVKGFAGLAARPAFALRGLAMRARLGGRYHAEAMIERIETDATGPVAVHWRDAAGKAQRTPCDMVGMGWHLRAETNLADIAGVDFDYDEAWAQWVPRADRHGRAADGIYLAGDGLRILGADGAEIAGRLAASACLVELGLTAPDDGTDLKRLAKMERFARGSRNPSPGRRRWCRPCPTMRSSADAKM